MAEPDQTTGWDGVRNFQARNTLRDDVKLGDGVLFYHSSALPPAIAGIAEVVREGHPDSTAFDPKAQHHDPRSDPEAPTWFQVSIRAVRPIDPPIGLPELKTLPALRDMVLLRKGSRLSVQPVAPSEWDAILAYDQKRETAHHQPAPPNRPKRKPASAAKPARSKKR
jgi:predicted RNA-binding protein with PUA-like domain